MSVKTESLVTTFLKIPSFNPHYDDNHFSIITIPKPNFEDIDANDATQKNIAKKGIPDVDETEMLNKKYKVKLWQDKSQNFDPNLLQKNMNNPNQNTPDYEAFTKDITLKDAVSKAVEIDREEQEFNALVLQQPSDDEGGDENPFGPLYDPSEDEGFFSDRSRGGGGGQGGDYEQYARRFRRGLYADLGGGYGSERSVGGYSEEGEGFIPLPSSSSEDEDPSMGIYSSKRGSAGPKAPVGASARRRGGGKMPIQPVVAEPAQEGQVAIAPQSEEGIYHALNDMILDYSKPPFHLIKEDNILERMMRDMTAKRNTFEAQLLKKYGSRDRIPEKIADRLQTIDDKIREGEFELQDRREKRESKTRKGRKKKESTPKPPPEQQRQARGRERDIDRFQQRLDTLYDDPPIARRRTRPPSPSQRESKSPSPPKDFFFPKKMKDDDEVKELQERFSKLKEPSMPHAPTHKPHMGDDDEPMEIYDEQLEQLKDRLLSLKLPTVPTRKPHISDDDDDPPRINPRKPPTRRNSDPSRKGALSLKELDDLRKASKEEKTRRQHGMSSVTLEDYQRIQTKLMETQEELRRAQGRDLQKQLEDEIRQLREYLGIIHPVVEREYPVALQRIEHLEQVIQDLEQQPAKVLKDPEQQQRIKDLEEELEELKRRPPPPPVVTKDPSDEEHIKSLQEELNHVKALLKSTESVAEKNPQAEEEIKQLRGAISELQGILRGRSEITVKGEEEIREYIQSLQQEIERLRTEQGVYEFQTGPSVEEGLVVSKKKRKPHQKGVKDFDWKKERKDVTKELIERSREERKAKNRKLFEAQVTQQNEMSPSEREIRQQESFNELIQLRDQYPDRIDYTTLSLPELDNYMRGIDNYRGKILTHLNRFGEDEQLRRVSNEIGPYLVEMNTYKRQLQQPPKPRSRTPSPPKTIATTTSPPPPPRPRSKSPSQQSRTPVFTASPPPPPPQPPTQPSPSFTQEEIDLARQLWEISRTGSTSEQDKAIKEMRKILRKKGQNGGTEGTTRGYFQKYYGKDMLDDPPERGRRGG